MTVPVGGGKPETAETAWEPDQSAHSMYCGMQGSHSDGAGQKGSCTCGRDDLVAALSLLQARHDAERAVWKAAVGVDKARIVEDLVASDLAVEQLEAQVARLERERDEARAGVGEILDRHAEINAARDLPSQHLSDVIYEIRKNLGIH